MLWILRRGSSQFSPKQVLRLSFLALPAGHSVAVGHQRHTSTRCCCNQDGISKPSADGDSDIRQECYPPESRMDLWFLVHSRALRSTGSCHMALATSPPVTAHLGLP